MKKTLTVLICITVLLSGCAWKYRALSTVAEWTNKNFDSIEKVLADPKTDEGEKAWLISSVNPYMNILKHTVIALGAIEEDNDVELVHEIHMIIKIATGARINVSGLEYGLKAKDKKVIREELNDLKSFTKMRMGIIKR